MTQKQLIDIYFEENNRIISTSQIVERGISKPVFYSYVNDNNLQMISREIYASKDAWIDGMHEMQLECKRTSRAN